MTKWSGKYQFKTMAQVYKIDNKRYTFVEVDSGVTTSYLLSESDHNKWIKIDTTTSSVNLQMPVSMSEGFRCVVENVGQFTINYVNAAGTSIATQQDPFTEDQFRTVEIVRNGSEWRVQGFVGRNDVSSLYDVNVTASGPLSDGQVLAYDGVTGNWRADDRLVLVPRSPETLDFILQESDHAKIIPVNTTAAPVDVALNLGLPDGFYVRIMNIGDGAMSITSAAALDIATTSINQKYGYIDLFHAGFEVYYGLIGRGGIEGGEPFFLANSGGVPPTATGTDSLAIGPASVATTNATNGVALGNAASTDAADAIQLGNGNNSRASSLQFLDNTIADDEGVILRAQNGDPAFFSQPTNPGQALVDATTGYLWWSTNTAWFFVNPEATLFYNFNRTVGGSPGNDWQQSVGTPFPAITERTLIAGSGNTNFTGDDTAIFGNSNSTTGDRGTALGYSNTLSGAEAVALGTNCNIQADGGVGIGRSAVTGATAVDAVQIGTGTNSTTETLGFIDEVIATKAGGKIALTTGAPTITLPTEGALPGLTKFDNVTNTLYIFNGSAWVSTVLT